MGLAGLAKKQLRKVFPDHWSFLLGEIALWSFVILLLTGVFLSLWFKPSMDRGAVPRHLQQPPRHQDVGGLRVHAEPVVRRPRRAADAADAPLGGDPVPGRDDDPHAAGLLHRRVPQAARDQLADRSRPADARHRRGIRRLLTPRRPALRHRTADRRRHHPLDPGRRYLPGRSSSSVGSSLGTCSSHASTSCTSC